MGITTPHLCYVIVAFHPHKTNKTTKDLNSETNLNCLSSGSQAGGVRPNESTHLMVKAMKLPCERRTHSDLQPFKHIFSLSLSLPLSLSCSLSFPQPLFSPSLFQSLFFTLPLSPSLSLSFSLSFQGSPIHFVLTLLSAGECGGEMKKER